MTTTLEKTRCAGSYQIVPLSDAHQRINGPHDDGHYLGNLVCPVCDRTTKLGTFKLEGHVSGHADVNARDADLLRAAAQRGQHGHSTNPSYYYLPYPGSAAGNSDAATAYWARQHSGDVFAGLDDQRVVRICVLLHRYHRYHQLATQVWPRWEETSRTNWADNSTDSHQTARDGSGRTRTVQLIGPGGDRCF